MLDNENPNNSSWGSYERYILAELRRLNEGQEKAAQARQRVFDDLQTQNSKLWTEIAVIKIKLAGWGMLGGMIATLTTLMLYLLLQVLK
jgi:hypothetical protein